MFVSGCCISYQEKSDKSSAICGDIINTNYTVIPVAMVRGAFGLYVSPFIVAMVTVSFDLSTVNVRVILTIGGW